MYDYIEGRKRIEEILTEKIEINEAEERIPQNKSFTFSNAYYGWVTGVFIDIRKSTELFQNENKIMVAKIIKSFTSELIEILKDNELLREIGIRGDCVYAIYTSPKKDDEYNIFEKVVEINTFIKMLNKLLLKNKFIEIEVGIGIATDKELIIKAGRENSGINNLVWIGKAVTTAANLSSFGSKNNIDRIVLSNLTYTNIIDRYKKEYPNDAEYWFRKININGADFYCANIIKINFNKYINENIF